MNNKGQTLVVFVLILPVFLVLVAYVVDKCYLLMEEKNLDNIAGIACSETLDELKTESDINQLILENDSKIEKITITKNTVTLEKEIDSLFGKVVGISTYKIKSSLSCIE